MEMEVGDGKWFPEAWRLHRRMLCRAVMAGAAAVSDNWRIKATRLRSIHIAKYVVM